MGLKDLSGYRGSGFAAMPPVFHDNGHSQLWRFQRGKGHKPGMIPAAPLTQAYHLGCPCFSGGNGSITSTGASTNTPSVPPAELLLPPSPSRKTASP